MERTFDVFGEPYTVTRGQFWLWDTYIITLQQGEGANFRLSLNGHYEKPDVYVGTFDTIERALHCANHHLHNVVDFREAQGERNGCVCMVCHRRESSTGVPCCMAVEDRPTGSQ